MKNIHRNALVATAICAILAAPAASAGDAALPVPQYVKYAKLLNGSAPAETTNVVKEVVSGVVKEAGEKAQQAVGEVAAAFAAVSTVKAETDSPTAAAIFENAVAAASGAGSDKAESLGFAKVAAAAGALVTGGADFVAGAGAGLSKNVAKEIQSALKNADEALSGLDAFAIKQVYEETLKALRAGSYQMKDDSDSVGLPAAVVTSFDDFGARATATTLSGSGIFVGKIHDPVIPKPKTTKPNPTPSGL